ncbi:hypothetical protein [Spirillospora sp. NPDC048823]|uniref:hypothetical protein n=1 Tax=unclassified Spirillospora TaxID=2642701 RepID=UPI0037128171
MSGVTWALTVPQPAAGRPTVRPLETFGGLEGGPPTPLAVRDALLPLPGAAKGYRHVLLLGTIRHLVRTERAGIDVSGDDRAPEEIVEDELETRVRRSGVTARIVDALLAAIKDSRAPDVRPRFMSAKGRSGDWSKGELVLLARGAFRGRGCVPLGGK